MPPIRTIFASVFFYAALPALLWSEAGDGPSGPSGPVVHPQRLLTFIQGGPTGYILTPAPPPGFIEQSIYISSVNPSSYYYIGPATFSIESFPLGSGSFQVSLPESTTNEYFIILDGINNEVSVIKGETIRDNFGSILCYNISPYTLNAKFGVEPSYVPLNISTGEYDFIDAPSANNKTWIKVYAPCTSDAVDEGDLTVSKPFPAVASEEIEIVSLHHADAADCVAFAANVSYSPPYFFDIDVDSDNDNGSGEPDRNYIEEFYETLDTESNPGKIIPVNNGDADFDNIADYYDGYDESGPRSSLTGCSFTPLVLQISEGLDPQDVTIEFTYDASDPSAVTVTEQDQGQDGEGGDSQWTARDGKIYELPGTGRLRLWTKDASTSRSPAKVTDSGDFIPSGEEIDFTDLNGGGTDRLITLYIEGVKYSSFPGDDSILAKMRYSAGSTTGIQQDKVRLTVAEVIFGEATGDACARDNYTFNSAQPTVGGGDSSSLVIYSMKQGGSMTANTLTLPAAPQAMNDAIEYYIGERTQGTAPLAPTDVSPDSSETFHQQITVDSTGTKGFSYLDAVAAHRSGGEVVAGAGAVVVLEERDIRLGIRCVDLVQSDGPNHTAPVLSLSDVQALEDYLNNVIYKQANIVWDVELLPTVSTDYDVIANDGILNLGTLITNTGERQAVQIAGNDSNFDYILFFVHDIPGNGGGAFLKTRYAYLDASHTGSLLNIDSAHEIGHSLGLAHPFGYATYEHDYWEEFPFFNDFDPENIMNYTHREKLRFYQWVYVNPLIDMQ